MEKLTQKQIGSKQTNEAVIRNRIRIDKENEGLAELYKVRQVLANGVEMTGTYIDMGVGKTEILRK